MTQIEDDENVTIYFGKCAVILPKELERFKRGWHTLQRMVEVYISCEEEEKKLLHDI